MQRFKILPQSTYPGPLALLDSDQSDSSYDPDEDCGDPLEMFVEDWALSLGREDTISLGLFLTFNLVKLFNFTKLLNILESDCTLCQWRVDFLKENCIPDNLQGKYQRSSVLWESEVLNIKAFNIFDSAVILPVGE